MLNSMLDESSLQYARYHFRPLLFIAIGGIAAEVLHVLRAYLYTSLGFLPPSARWLVIDFLTDAPKPPMQLFAEEIPQSLWEQVAFEQAERSLLETDVDCLKLAERMRCGEEDVAWLNRLVPPAVVERYTGAEACQIPALLRLFLCFAATVSNSSGDASWLEKLKAHLMALFEGGDALHRLPHGVPLSSISKKPALAVIVSGAEGGTGVGGLLPLAITLRWLSSKLGLWLQIHAVVLSGHYRPADGQENRKAALSHALDLDLESVMSPNNGSVEIPLGPDQSAIVGGKLFDLCYRHEASDRLMHNQHGIVAVVARTLKFQYFSKAGFEMEKSRNNIGMIPGLRSLAEAQESWSQPTDQDDLEEL